MTAKELPLTLAPELYDAIRGAAQDEGKTPEQWVAEAAQKRLLDKRWQTLGAEAEERRRRSGMTDEQIEDYVERVIHEHRQERRR